MIGKTLGYVPISSLDQNLGWSLDVVILNKTFGGKASAKDAQRLQRLALIDHTRDGDTVLVHNMDRLTGHNLRQRGHSRLGPLLSLRLTPAP